MNVADVPMFRVMFLRRWLRTLPFKRFREPPARVAVIRLDGVIAAATGRLRRGNINLQSVELVLERAFAVPDVAAVAILVNSPGGSPVQSSLVAGRIRAHAEEKNVPVLTFVEDVAASGGYWLACAGDEIFADSSSILGSIGVIFSSFGFTDFIARHGVERRLHTAGENKGALDPFRPESPADVARLEQVQGAIHESFKAWVRSRRGARLSGPEDELFSGAFWVGAAAVDLGLVDGIGDLRGIVRERFGDDVKLIKVSRRRSLFAWMPGISNGGATDFATSMGEAVIDRTLSAIEERALWSRFGL